MPVTTAEGEQAVLKVQQPHRESEHEAAALELWDGDGAIRLLDSEPEEHALLLERCVPGTPLSAVGGEAALDVFVELLPRLWKPAGAPFGTLAAEAAWWADSLEETWERFARPFERRLLDAALEALLELPRTQGQQVLLHQDLHGDNVLAAQREPWLAIDPKPLVGEREFGIAPVVRSRELGHSQTRRAPPLRPPDRRARPRPRAGARLDDRPDDRLGLRRRRPADARRDRPLAARSPLMLRAVLFDVDFTIARPGPELGPEGYRRLGERFGLELDPSRYGEARERAVEGIKRHPELEHDEEIWVAFTERIIRGMGGDADSAYECAVEMTQAWEHAEHFELFEDAPPVLEELRAQGMKLGLVSNTGRDLDAFVAHHRLQVDAALGSGAFGRTKPHPTIFRAVLERLGVEPEEAAMVGDSIEDDIEGAHAAGIERAFLLDREDRHPEVADRLPDLFALPAALGLNRPGAV